MTTEGSERWVLRTRELQLGNGPLVMGIVNVTPDSFSDGGMFPDADAAVQHALRLVHDGADVLDIGGESTRPNAPDVGVDEELDRVLPVVREIVARTDTPISVDTTKAAVAEQCIDAGAEIINDVTGFEADGAMVPLVAASGVGACIMHMQGTPRTMQLDPRYDDVVAEVTTYLAQRRQALIDGGVDPARICVDPGIGFGKTVDHNLELLRAVRAVRAIGSPVLYGHSRKSFIGKVLGDVTLDRDSASVGVSLALALQGVDVVRVHDVAGTVRALRLFRASQPRG